MLLVITAFTIGHSLSLALSTFDIFVLNSSLVEFLIALTIVLTCVYNIKMNKTSFFDKRSTATLLAGTFGVIHGMGFAGLLKEMMPSNAAVLLPLFSFNIGLEIGQIIIVGIIFLLMHLFKIILHLQQQRLSFFVSLGVGCIGLLIAISRFNDLLH